MLQKYLGAGVCGGDQGGPLVYNQVGNYVQTGIVSWAAPCGNSDPDTYARVSKVVDWIKVNFTFMSFSEGSIIVLDIF